MEEEEHKDPAAVPDALSVKLENMLLNKRRLFLSSAIDDKSAQEIIRRLWFLELQDPGKPILLVINSPGGSVDSGFAIWDQIKMIESEVTTLVTGLAASMGSVLSLAAAPNKRFATPNARIMIHQPLIPGVIQGQATDLEIQAKEIIKTRNAIIDLYADATGKGRERIEETIDRDTWMSVDEAIDFGLLDAVATSYKDLGFA